ncbi:MAG TPA: Lrp/AsnC family transcriptional regulator [Rhizomicrobium sp.]|nr:Lrp/AsnC family transcriptional regulator [Rhizomicrobium sp.]
MLDVMDRKLLALLQRDANLSVAEIGDRIGLSATPCWRRLKRLEEEGYIERRVALVNRDKVGLPVTAFVSIRTNQHDDEWLDAFMNAAAKLPEIVEIYDVSGETDYLMKVVVADIESLNRVCKTLVRAVKVADISSAFVLDQLKYTTELPLEKTNLPDTSWKSRRSNGHAGKTNGTAITAKGAGLRRNQI